MTDGEYIMPRVSQYNGTKPISVIDIEDSSISEQQTPSEIVSHLRTAFNTGKTKPYEYRVEQLENVKKFLKNNKAELCNALYEDLRKSEHESHVLEIDILRAKVSFTLKHLKSWMQPERPAKPLMNFCDQLLIYPEPLGVVLVMGAWNYPLLLTLSPVLGAIAAGNCCVMKPSDVTPSVSELLYKVLPNYLDKECFSVYLGGIPETTELLKERFDYIFFTGSPPVGKIIYQAATKHLTPCTLELGGKSPTFIDSTANIQLATKRILWGKVTNCGQTCVAPDYILCDKDVENEFINYAKEYLKDFFGSDIKQSKDLARIVNERHFIRIGNLMKNQKIAIGGKVDAQELYIAPTIIVDVKPDDPIMKEEVFGPVLPIITVENAAEAIKFINEREKPLALYVFTQSQEIKDLFLKNTSSGSVCINDTVLQVSVETLPFGGVGNSGMGCYNGKKSFETFTHNKSVLLKNYSIIGEKAMTPRYPPYTWQGTKFIRCAIRNLSGTINLGWLKYVVVFGLGVAVAVGGVCIKKRFDEEW